MSSINQSIRAQNIQSQETINIKNKSRQNKARYLQNLVKDRIVKTFRLAPDDARTSIVGESGEVHKSL